MNLGKKVAPTGSHRFGVVPPGAYRPGRANWDSQMTRLFLQLAIKEIEAEGKGTTQLSNNSLCNIAAEISARTGEVVNLKQCKDRYGVLKQDWQAWTLLVDSRRGATGLARGVDAKGIEEVRPPLTAMHSGREGELGMGANGRRALATTMTTTDTCQQNQYKSVIKHGCNMVDIVKILGRMEYFQQEPVPPVYWWLIDYLSGDPMKMDVFYGLPNDEQRIFFAQREHTKAIGHTSTDIVNSTGQDRNWAFQLRSTCPDDIGRGTFDLGNFTRLLETGVYPENYPIFNSGNGGNELPNFNCPRAHQQSNEIYQNGEGFGNMPWVNRFATTGQGDAGPSDNVPRVQQFVEEYNSSPHLYASSDFRNPFNSIGHGTEPHAGYDNWEWMNNNNGNAGSSTNVFDDDANADSEYSIPTDEFYAEIGEDELLVDLLTVALLHAIQILRRPQRLPFHTCPLSSKAYLHDLMNARDERFQLELCMPNDTFAKIVRELQETYGWSSS
ncbi:hypothetical protein C3L33_02268, partial [Rhododendron williamsianum]